jgi:hypothetical protein
MGAASDNAERNVWFSYNGVVGRPVYDNDFKYNPSTNSLHIVHANGKDPGELRITYSTTVDMGLGIGSGNANHGLYDFKASKWMIYADGSGDVTVNGNATTATKLGTSTVGGTDRPIYLNAGAPTQTTYRMAATNAAATTARAITDNLETGNWYVNGTNSTDLYSVADGVAYVEKYNDSWIHEIYGDYRTG